MKKSNLLLSALLAASVVAGSMSIGVSAGVVQEGAVNSANLPAGTLIYKETFDGITAADTDASLKALGWSKVEKLTKYTANLSIKDGKLIIANEAADSNDSYALMMDDEYLKNVCNADYTYQYDVTYTGAGNTSRYVSLLCNYDGNNNYNTVDMRIRGDGYNQTRRGDQWIHYNNTTCPIRATDDTAAITQLFGEKFDANGMLLKGKTITIRVETSIEKGPTVYVNGIMMSDMQANKDKWNTIDAYAMCFKASKLIGAEIDNIMVWTGTADEPLPIVEEETEPEAAQTADASSVALFGALAAAAVLVAVKKRK